jgi:hypothetical protein
MGLAFNDFGFTAVSADELDEVQSATETAIQSNAEAELLQAKLYEMYNAIVPLLDNLRNDLGRDYIYWPGVKRKEVIDAFQANLVQIRAR